MYICYVCNGLETLRSHCPKCHHQMADGGKVGDYYGDYSPYMEQEDARRLDGIPGSNENHQCVHIVFCPACDLAKEILIAEQKH